MSDTTTFGKGIERTAGSGDLVAAPDRLRRGTTIGRYIVVDLLGRGGMGSVYSAWDTELRRRVALKLLHDRSGAQLRDGLVVEARALAKLRHPNVVTVHDVGQADGRVFVAMEHIEGTTLGAWAEAVQPNRRQRLDVLLQCSDGLAAAHEAGLVHDDFKSSNVVVEVTPLGVVAQIIDFGLARVADGPADEVRGGTPAYMAPERRNGALGTALSDQWSFAKTAVELLGAARWAESGPQTGTRTGVPLAAAKLGALGPILRRALADRPSDRWPSQRALSNAIRGAAVRRRRRGWLALSSALVVGAAAIGQQGLLGTDCAGDGAEALASALPEANRAQWTAAISARDAALGESVRGNLEGWASRWTDAYVARCGDRSGDRRAPVLGCLERQATDTASQLSVMADSATSSNAQWQLFAGMVRTARPNACDEAVRSHAPAPPALAEAAALELAGRYDDALDAVQRARADVSNGEAETRAAALYREASIQYRRDDTGAALALGMRAIDLASIAGDHELVAHAMILRAQTHIIGGDYASATEAATLARASVHAAGDPPRLLARWHFQQGRGYEVNKEYAKAGEAYQESLRIWEQFDPDGLYVADASLNLALTFANAGSCEAALPLQTRAVSIYEAMLGSRHPTVAHALVERARCLASLGHVEDAILSAQRAADVVEASLGARSVELGIVLTLQASILGSLGRYDEAAPIFERAVEVRVDVLGPDHPETAVAQSNYGWLLVATGKPKLALAHFEAALAAQEKLYGKNSFRSHNTLGGLAAVHGGLGDDATALTMSRRALELAEQGPDAGNPVVLVNAILNLAEYELRTNDPHAKDSFARAYEVLKAAPEGRNHPAWPSANIGQGDVALAEQELASARDFYSAALADSREDTALPGVRAAASLGLAFVDVAEGKSASTVREAIQTARNALAAAPDMHRTLAQADAWLAANPAD